MKLLCVAAWFCSIVHSKLADAVLRAVFLLEVHKKKR